jgi:hypothetical protein
MNYYEIVFNSLSLGLYSVIKTMVISNEIDRKNNEEMKYYLS